MNTTRAVLIVAGLVASPLGVFLATLEVCVQYIIVLGERVCTQSGFPYQTPGLALLTMGILLFVVGLVMVVLERDKG